MAKKRKCNCAKQLKEKIVNYITPYKYHCPNCAKLHYVDVAPINWDLVISASIS